MAKSCQFASANRQNLVTPSVPAPRLFSVLPFGHGDAFLAGVTALLAVPIESVAIPETTEATKTALASELSFPLTSELSFSDLLEGCLNDEVLEEEPVEPSEETSALNTAGVIAAEPAAILFRLFGNFTSFSAGEAEDSDGPIPSMTGGNSGVAEPDVEPSPQVTVPDADLAFAVQVTEADAVQDGEISQDGGVPQEPQAPSKVKEALTPPAPSSGRTTPASGRKAEEPGTQSSELKAEPLSSGDPVLAAFPTTSSTGDPGSNAISATLSPPEIRHVEPARVEYVPANESLRAPEPPKFAVRLDPIAIDGTGKPSVEVHVEQRGTSLHFAVHSADSSLAADMRASLGDLTGALERQGFEAQSWHSVEAVAATREAEMSGSDQEAGNTPGERHSGGGEQGQNHQQREGRDRSVPDWLAELETSLFAPGQLNRSFS